MSSEPNETQPVPAPIVGWLRFYILVYALPGMLFLTLGVMGIFKVLSMITSEGSGRALLLVTSCAGLGYFLNQVAKAVSEQRPYALRLARAFHISMIALALAGAILTIAAAAGPGWLGILLLIAAVNIAFLFYLRKSKRVEAALGQPNRIAQVESLTGAVSRVSPFPPSGSR